MGRERKIYSLVLLLLLLIGVVSYGCGWFGSGSRVAEGVTEVQFPLLPEETITVTGTINDAATGTPIGLNDDSTVSVTIQGDDRDEVVDGEGNKTTTFTVDQGMLTFYLRDVGLPANIRVVAKSDGFVSSSKDVTISNEGVTTFSIEMVEIDNPPEGVKVTQEPGESDATGAVVAVIIAETPPEDVTSGTATVTIPEATVIRDENGTPVTGTLTTTVTYNNNTATESLQTFPGGFLVYENTQGQPEEGAFISGGFASIEITDTSGKEAKTFDTPITLTIQVPGSTINPETGNPIQNSDQIPIWSYNTETGNWSFEIIGTAVGPDANGNFDVTFTADHLSYWNLDWREDPCTGEIKIAGGAGYILDIEVSRTSGGGYFSRISSVKDDFIDVVNAPPEPLTFTAYYGPDIVGTAQVDNLCNESPVILDIAIPAVPRSDLNIHVEEMCKDVPPQPLPSSTIAYESAEDGYVIAGETDVSGNLVIQNLVIGRTYTIYAFNRREGKYESRTITIAEGGNSITFTFTIPSEDCPPPVIITGGSGGGE